MMEINCVVSGNVQQVAYRAYTQDAATDLAVVGYAKNQTDGTVLVVAQGDPAVLKEFIEHLHEGSLLARVEAVSVDWQTPQQHFDDFSIRH